MLCPECLGGGCRECKRGIIRQQERPGSLVTEEGADLFEAYGWLKNYGHLPAPGGFLEQAAAFVDAVAWCDSVHSAYATFRGRRNEEAAKLAKRLNEKMGRGKSGRSGR